MRFDAVVEKVKGIAFFRAIYDLPGVAHAYHFLLAFAAAALHGFPSRRMTVIGVTGTKGKTTTCSLIAQILNHAGRRTGVITTAAIGIGNRIRVNDTKQTMLGRLELQRLLKEMADAGCAYAVVETSSEGILQHRHRFIDYRVAVFTNLSPEHIERHGSFENYREAKVKLFERVAKKAGGVGVYNLDDPHVAHFLRPPVTRKYGFGRAVTGFSSSIIPMPVKGIRLGAEKTVFSLSGEWFEMPLPGEFNVWNAAAAICVAVSQGVSTSVIREALRAAEPVPGRLECLDCGQKFTVLVDYAHEPASLEAVYRAAKIWKPKRMIGLLGAQGGGRDRWKREAMGRIAGRYLDVVVLANEDPYDENPATIIEDVAKGVQQEMSGKKRLYKIVDRREAIRKVISLARPGDVALFTGKGGEVWMCVERGRKVPWNEREVVEKALRDRLKIKKAR